MFYILDESATEVTQSEKSSKFDDLSNDLNNPNISPEQVNVNDSDESVANNVGRSESLSIERDKVDATTVNNDDTVNGKILLVIFKKHKKHLNQTSTFTVKLKSW